jgi:hypothetical protein
MIRLITLMIILTNCTTVDTENRCPRVPLYNYSGLPINEIDLKYAENAPKMCKRRNKHFPCVSFMVKRGEIDYYIKCSAKPRYDGTDPIIIKGRLPND